MCHPCQEFIDPSTGNAGGGQFEFWLVESGTRVGGQHIDCTKEEDWVWIARVHFRRNVSTNNGKAGQRCWSRVVSCGSNQARPSPRSGVNHPHGRARRGKGGGGALVAAINVVVDVVAVVIRTCHQPNHQRSFGKVDRGVSFQHYTNSVIAQVVTGCHDFKRGVIQRTDRATAIGSNSSDDLLVLDTSSPVHHGGECDRL